MIKQFFRNNKIDLCFNVKNENLNHKVFFVHIPKTAGTSFRLGLIKCAKLISDYGSHNPDTSEVIQGNIYENIDFFQCKRDFLSKEANLICGHVFLNKYIDFVPVNNTFTFIREPLSQIQSHYNHHVNYAGFTESFEVFYRDNAFVNVQSRYLQGLPISLLGYIGITEKYDESLELINHYLGVSIAYLSKNISPKKYVQTSTLSSLEKEAILELNKKDVSTYQQALEYHRQRYCYYQNRKIWTYLHAVITHDNVLTGCAYFQNSDETVELDVYINDSLLKKLAANQFFWGFTKANFPRERYVGFYLPLSAEYHSHIDSIVLKVTKTGQEYSVDIPPRLQLK